MKTEDEEKELHWILDILSYPFRGSGKYILISLTILSVIFDLVFFAPIIGIVAGLIVFTYLCAVYMNLINSSACGDAEAPFFPEISNVFSDVIVPTIQVLLTLLVSFLPLIVYVIVVASLSGEENSGIAIGLVIFGLVYFPMGLLAVAVLGSIGAVNPYIILPSIFRAMPHYLIALLLLIGVLAVQAALNVGMAQFADFPGILEYAIHAVISVYVLMANARTLGLVFREREEELGWI